MDSLRFKLLDNLFARVELCLSFVKRTLLVRCVSNNVTQQFFLSREEKFIYAFMHVQTLHRRVIFIEFREIIKLSERNVRTYDST